MGKWTDKQYITHSEWTRDFGGVTVRRTDDYKRLPFNFCALSLAPFENPVCTEDGIVFDLLHIVPFVQKFGVNPVTGAPLTIKSLTKLSYYKNDAGEYCDPVTFKVFNENTHLVAVKVSGNVYEAETIERLNAKAKNWRDLLSDEPFSRKDVIDLHDPTRLDYRHNFIKFHHVVNKLSVNAEEEERRRQDPVSHINVSSTTARVLKQVGTVEMFKPPASMQPRAPEAGSSTDGYVRPGTEAHFSTGRMAASFTSTAVPITSKSERAHWHEDDVMYAAIKKKGYVRLVTNLGPLSLELHCDLAPMTTHNFILLCKRGYYDNTLFHRSIKNFMIQGGDPTGTGTGGESAWTTPFKDEFRNSLTHEGRGVLSMANKGPDTNKSQFFITYKSCKHLDRKHTIFGKVVGGMETLDKMDAVATDSKDRPKEPIKILQAEVFVDPFEEYVKEHAEEARKAREAEEAKKKAAAAAGSVRGAWFSNPANRPTEEAEAGDGPVGKHLAKALAAQSASATATAPPPATAAAPAGVPVDDKEDYELYAQQKKRRLAGKSDMSDFSAW